jgi:translation initiation factor 1 (eIF-1/SUI1)
MICRTTVAIRQWPRTVERVRNDTEIVVQGDQPARVAELLRARGFRVDGVTS